ncbi:SusC/RagA family TonB-linked outer membrane protein [Sphingobacterium kyonggiense]
MKKLLLIVLLGCFFSTFAQTQMRKFHGVIVDENGDPISDITIATTNNANAYGYTGLNGKFSVSVPVNIKTVTIRHLNYVTRTIAVPTDEKEIKIVMKSRTDVIEEVVVGYVGRKKETLTGSAIVIKMDDIKDAPAANFTDLLQGRAAGLNVQLNTGTPGMAGSINIRGVNTANIVGEGPDAYVTSTSPLFVIDGVPIENTDNFEYGFQTQGTGISPLAMIPPDDIESVTILKDAQATSLYGAQGAYGVILVTTKRGNSQIPMISYTSRYFLNTVPRLRDVIGGKGERDLRIYSILNNDLSYLNGLKLIHNTPMLADSINPYYNNATNWQSYFYGNTFNTNQNLNISGGNQNFNYKLAPGYSKEYGIIANTGFTRYNLNSNMQFRPNNKFLISAYVNGGLVRNSLGSGNAYQQKGVASSANTSSLLPSPSIFAGSYDALLATAMESDNKTGNLSTNINIEYEILKGLRFTTTGQYAYNIQHQDKFTPELLNAGSNLLYVFRSNNNSIYNRNLLRYSKDLSPKHNISAYAFHEMRIANNISEAMRIIGTGNDNIQSGIGYSSTKSTGGTLENQSESRSLSYAAAFTYQYDNKYIVEGSYRMDGSSLRSIEKPWTINPSVGLRWNIHRENFVKEIDWLNEASIRTSLGRNIVPVGTRYDAFGRYSLIQGTYNGDPAISLNLATLPNTNLLPVTNTTFNLGTDISMFNNRFNFVYEFYYKQTDDELVNVPLTDVNGFSAIKLNTQAMVNIGNEFSFSYRPNFKNTNWRGSINFNVAINNDYLTRLANDSRQEMLGAGGYTNILKRLGRNTTSNVLYHYRGVYLTDEDVPVNPATGLRYRVGTNTGADNFFRAGDPIFTDLNKDYILDERDLVIAGNSQPKIVGGFSITLQYQQWSLLSNFSYLMKRDVINSALADRFKNYYNPGASTSLVPIDMYNYYGNGSSNPDFPYPFDFRRATIVDAFRHNSTLFQEDGSYLKFNTMTMFYNFKKELLRRIWNISSARLSLTANNIYTFSRYSGPDPELMTSLGYDSSNGYPRARTFSFGLDIQF